MAKTEEKYSPQTLKSAREHEEWIRGVVNHEYKWIALRFLVRVVNFLFMLCVSTSAVLILVVIFAGMVKMVGQSWIPAFVLAVGLLCVIKFTLSYEGSKMQLITHDFKTPLLIDKIDKKEVKDE